MSFTHPVALKDAFSSDAPSLNGQLMVDYLFLDRQDKKMFVHSHHEYLITQLQTLSVETISSINKSIDMDINHPVKELIWTLQDVRNESSPLLDWSNYTIDIKTYPDIDYDLFDGGHILSICKLLLNDHEREDENADYFNYLIPFYRHSGRDKEFIYILFLFIQKSINQLQHVI